MDYVLLDSKQCPKAHDRRGCQDVRARTLGVLESFKDIGYIGNVPRSSYLPVTEEERAIRDAKLSKHDYPLCSRRRSQTARATTLACEATSD
jgi:hypothetical protein